MTENKKVKPTQFLSIEEKAKQYYAIMERVSHSEIKDIAQDKKFLLSIGMNPAKVQKPELALYGRILRIRRWLYRTQSILNKFRRLQQTSKRVDMFLKDRALKEEDKIDFKEISEGETD